MTIQDALQQAVELFEQSTTPRLDAQILLAHVLKKDRAYLVAYNDKDLSDEQQETFDRLVLRRAEGEPIAYILGKKAFYDIELTVSKDVLIPRPETEELVETAIKYAKADERIKSIADIGTGSGAIALALKKHLPQVTIHATDISKNALAIARMNAVMLDLDVKFREGNLAQPLIDAGIKVDMLLANLPYIPQDDLAQLNVAKFEPDLALNGGKQGLLLIKHLLRQVRDVCNDGAFVLLEIGYNQGEMVSQWAQMLAMPRRVRILTDLAGHDRIAEIRLS